MGIEETLDPVGLQRCSINNRTHPRHVESTQKEHGEEESKKFKGLYKCSECQKHFGNHLILQLHLQIHQANKQTVIKNSISDTPSEAADLKIRNYNAKKDLPAHKETKLEDLKLDQNHPAAKKVIGLTKVRFEDCRRCDACSCIYLDESDYHKHMKNFHNQSATKKTRIRTKKVCISCCKNCKCNGNHEHPTPQKPVTDKRLHHKIKDRWSKLMQGTATSANEMCNKEDIKTEPVDDTDDMFDYSHLLSQVEVRIKTEPPE